MKQLGGCRDHDCVLIGEGELSPSQMYRAKRVAAPLFRSWQMIQTRPPTPSGWPKGPNAQFEIAVRHTAKGTKPWLWIECDCCPLTRIWLPLIEEEYQTCLAAGKRFLGAMCGRENHPYLQGTAVYPPNIIPEHARTLRYPKRPFDLAMGPMVVPQAMRSKRIANNYHGSQRAHIPTDAVFFHRDKTGILQRTIAASMEP